MDPYRKSWLISVRLVAPASPLTRTGEGEYTLSASLNAGSASGVKTAFIHVKQGDGNTVHEVRYPHTLVVMPSERLEDRVVFDDALSDGGAFKNKAWSESHPYDLNEDAVVFGGERSASFRVFDGDWDWVVRFRPGERFHTAGYESLRFAVNVDRMFHPRQQGPTFLRLHGRDAIRFVRQRVG